MFFKLTWQFGVQRTLRDLKAIERRVNVKQTVADKRQLQSFVETQVREGKLIQTLNRTSKYDDGYTQFLEDFKKKNNMPNILDLSHYANPLNKSTKLREEELQQLKDFQTARKRGLFERVIARGGDNVEKNADVRDGNKIDMGVDEMGVPEVQNTRSGLQISGDFYTLLIDRDVNTQVTTLNRINHFRQLVFMGDCNGVIGYGRGKGNDFEEALVNAIQNVKRNLIPIPLDIFHSCPLSLKARFNRFEIEINSRADGMNAYGHPTVSGLLMLTGLTHCSFKVYHRNTTPYAMLNAYFKCVTQNLHAQEVAERAGFKVYRQFWGKPLPRDVISNEVFY